MLRSPRFPAYLEGSHHVPIPEEIALPFHNGGHQRIAVHAFFQDKELRIHAKLHHRQDRYFISFGKRYQKEIGLFPTDFFELQIEEDTSKYGVEVPETFQAVLESDAEGTAVFETLSAGQQRSLIYHVKRVKSTALQIEKSLAIFDNLKRGVRDPRDLVKKQ